jgi:hypothetical protein
VQIADMFADKSLKILFAMFRSLEAQLTKQFPEQQSIKMVKKGSD